MASELIFRGHNDDASPVNYAHFPKPSQKRWTPIRYFFQEQRPLFFLLGIAIAFFFILSAGWIHNPVNSQTHHYTVPVPVVTEYHRSVLEPTVFRRQLSEASVGAKIPLTLKTKGKRIVVTGGAGFVGSHLVDRLIERGDSVIVVDNFFTGRKENVMHHMGNPRFELIRHDVVEPILLEVDEIYHLACPASPVHYKFNPGKTIRVPDPWILRVP